MLRAGLFICITLIFAFGCTSLPKALEQIEAGWDKSDVVEAVGSPSRSYRKESVDYWVYKYYESDVPQSKVVLIKGNKVIAVVAEPMSSKATVSTTDREMREYKEGLRKKRQGQSGFQDIE